MALTQEQNDRLTRVGPGTPMGSLLRRYWHVVAAASELEPESVISKRLLGEDLALYRSEDGELGLLSRKCAHRGAGLDYGIPEPGGLRCPYHGWKYDKTGLCIETPAEPPEANFVGRVRIPGYPVQELGGLIWAYMGPEPTPLLPRWDLLVRDDLERNIGMARLPINFLQAMENSLDPVHFEYLHGMFGNFMMKKQGRPPAMTVRKHVKMAFDPFELGIRKRRLLEGQPEDDDDWTTGHPVLFPTILTVNTGANPMLQIRVPVDDTTTIHYWYLTSPRPEGAPPQTTVPMWDNPFRNPDGRLKGDTTNSQDMLAWVTQGEIADRTTERLGSSDRGIMMYRRMLLEQMEKVERGEDPLGVIRDPAMNEPMIEIEREGFALKAMDVKFELTYAQQTAALGQAMRRAD
jgi:5,5'-dehydrodivanillate O-demethylase oxygenase subunit